MIRWSLQLFVKNCFVAQKLLPGGITDLPERDDGIFVIIAAKNQERKIEGFLRAFLFRWIYGKEEYIKDIYIVDLNSTDNTNQIIEKLKPEYQQIKICDWNTCKHILEKKCD